jgi:cytochrome P450
VLSQTSVSQPAGATQPWGPRGFPVFGCLNGLLRDPLTFWSDVANNYNGIARVPLKGRHVYLISDPELLYELLITKRTKYRKNTRYKAAVDTFGEGLLLLEGERWKRMRLVTQPAFKQGYLAGEVPTMARITSEFLDRWSAACQGGTATLDTEEEFLRLTQTIAGHYLMGPGFAAIDDRFRGAATAIKKNWPIPPRSLIGLYRKKDGDRGARLDAAIKYADSLIREYLAGERKTDFADSGLVSMLVRTSREQGDEYDDTSLRDQLMSLFFAGHETSAMTLTWAHYLISQHPDVRTRMCEEVKSVVGDRVPTAEDVDRLDYVERVLNETLRLYSPIHSISRVALEDDTIGGFKIAEGSMIYVSLYATHRLPYLWPDPDKFDPDRFLPELVAERPRFAFIPFAAGHRNCVGANMAVVEAKLVLAMIAQRFGLDLAKGHRVRTSAETTMRPLYGMKMDITPI